MSINSELLKQAKALDIKLSTAKEQSPAAQLSTRQKEQWITDNKKAINAYNNYVDEQGSFGDKARRF